MDDDYLRSIAQTFKGKMEEEEKAGLIMDYKGLILNASNREDFNIPLWWNTKTWRRLTVCAVRQHSKSQ